MKIIKFNEFEDGYILKEYENDGNYDVIGCFKEPDFYTIVGNSDFFEYEGDDAGYFNTTLDFEAYVSNEEEIKSLYKKLKKYVKDNNNVDDCVVFGVFLNGENSCLVCSDNDYSYEMFLLGSMLNELGIKRTDSNYLRDAHANKEEIEEEYPKIYPKIKDYFNTK